MLQDSGGEEALKRSDKNVRFTCVVHIRQHGFECFRLREYIVYTLINTGLQI